MTDKAMDLEALRDNMGPGSVWATTNGKELKKRREFLNLTVRQLASLLNLPVQTVYRIEAGDIVPKDYLRAAYAHVFMCDPASVWPAPTRETIATYWDVAA